MNEIVPVFVLWLRLFCPYDTCYGAEKWHTWNAYKTEEACQAAMSLKLNKDVKESEDRSGMVVAKCVLLGVDPYFKSAQDK